MVTRSRLARLVRLAPALVAFALSACAGTGIDSNLRSTRQFARDHFAADVRWITSDAARQEAQAEINTRLAKPLAQSDAVQIALAYSPAFQAMLSESSANVASAAQNARLPNPVFAFERLVRGGGADRELEINRILSFSVLDLFLLPARIRQADYQREAARLTLSSHVVQVADEARSAWVNAVAAQQALQYFEQVKATADASAELARRMQAVGNFTRLQRAREQAFAADAVARLARARLAVRTTREALVRTLGLNDAQAAALRLPDRLPDLPESPRDEVAIAKFAIEQRLDVQLAKANLDFVARELGLTRVTSYVNGMEVGLERNSATGVPTQRGFEVTLPLPVFDFGDARRARAGATYMSALNRAAQVAVEANSRVREQYDSYRTAYDIARHYRDEIVPLRKLIAEENLLRYNGMLIGVFELLADASEQVASVVQAIDAQRDFWLADASLQATLVGRPISVAGGSPQHRARSGGDSDERR